jgi:hypothetical protein
MDELTALHTAVRRYCQKEFSKWTRRYATLSAAGRGRVPAHGESSWDYSEEAYEMFPRYRIAEAIQIEVERIVPSDSNSLENLRVLLLEAARAAEDRLTAEMKSPAARTALSAEADEYRSFLGSWAEADLRAVEPLPYRRVIDAQESERIWAGLKVRWEFDGHYWFPLKRGDPPPDVIAFHTEFFCEMRGLELLREALMDRGVTRIFQLHESGPDYDIEFSIFDPQDSAGEEQYSTSESLDWLVYASHESSITIAGDWLVAFFQREWPEWKEKTYQGPFSTADLRGTWEWETK